VGGNRQAQNAVSNVARRDHLGVPKTDRNNIGPRIGLALGTREEMEKLLFVRGFGIAYDVKVPELRSITLPPHGRAKWMKARHVTQWRRLPRGARTDAQVSWRMAACLNFATPNDAGGTRGG